MTDSAPTRTELAANLGGLFLFDTMCSQLDADDVIEYLQFRLGRDLATLAGVGAQAGGAATAAGQQAMILWISQHGFRLRGVESGTGTRGNTSFYHSRFESVRNAIIAWLADPATTAVLGPPTSAVSRAMAQNLDIGYGRASHDYILGSNDNLRQALEGMARHPPPPVTLPTQIPVAPPGQQPAAPPAQTPARPPATARAGSPFQAPSLTLPADGGRGRPMAAPPTPAQVATMPRTEAQAGEQPVLARVLTAALPLVGTANGPQMWTMVQTQFTAPRNAPRRGTPTTGDFQALTTELFSTTTVTELRGMSPTQRTALLQGLWERLLPAAVAPPAAGATTVTRQAEIRAEEAMVSDFIKNNAAGGWRACAADCSMPSAP